MISAVYLGSKHGCLKSNRMGVVKMRDGEQKREVTPFAQWLKLSRKRRGLTQEALADAAGVHFTYISKIELGQKVPLRDVIAQIAAALVPEDADEHTARHLLNSGMAAAGFSTEPSDDLETLVSKAGYNPDILDDAGREQLRQSVDAAVIGVMEMQKRKKRQ